MGRRDFKEFLDKVASKFREAVSGNILLVSNLDADGISAAAIMSKSLERLGLDHDVEIIHQLREAELKAYSERDYDAYIFTDLGSGALKGIEEHLKNKDVLVLDHHHPQGKAKNIWHVNPHLFDVDGSDEISASGVTFLFCRALDKNNEDLAHLALVGAIGDVQEDDGFNGLNDQILDIGIEKGVIEVKKGLNLYGRQTRPLHKLLEYSSDLDIPGVSNSESGAIQFLSELGINPRKEDGWRTLVDLSEDERQRLVAGIIMKRNGKDEPNDVFSNVYVIPHEEGVFRDPKEFSTLLNACGRLDEPVVGMDACLDRPGAREKALNVKNNYKVEIMESLRWYEENEDNPRYVTKGKNYIIINAEDNVLNTVIGTLISILSKSGNVPPNTILLSMARKPNDVTKISIRVSDNPEGIHLDEIVSEIAESVGGKAGGHQYAAGALIPTEKEKKFVENAKEILSSV